MVASVVNCLTLTFSKNFSETTGPISFKFHVPPPGKGVKKVYIFHRDHLTKMAMSICGKNLKKFSFPEPLSLLP